MEYVDATESFPKRIVGTTKTFEDLFTVKKKSEMKLCNCPKLNYLNLLDYKDKKGNFHSTFFECIELYENSCTFAREFEAFEEYNSVSIFYFYIEHLKNIPKDSIDLQVFNKKISHAAAILKHCDSLLPHLYSETIDLYCDPSTDKILLPIILKHMCSSELMIAYTAKYIFTYCNESFLEELLDSCIKCRFDVWSMWTRNSNLNIIYFCPVTYAYSSAKLNLLKVLLDYGFHHTHQKVATLKIVLEEHPRASHLQWLNTILFKDVQSPRSLLIDEVFFFIFAFSNSYTDVCETLAKCFRLAWDARKEPYVTKLELLNLLQNYFGCLSRRKEYKHMRRCFQKRFDCFQTSIPDYQGLVPQPRSLKHLCRCTVREALNNNWKMPYGVSELPIPYGMKSYILLR